MLIQCTPLVEKAGVAPDVTFRITACKQERVQARYPLWIWNPWGRTHEVQNRSNQWLHKMDLSPDKKFKKKKKEFALSKINFLRNMSDINLGVLLTNSGILLASYPVICFWKQRFHLKVAQSKDISLHLLIDGIFLWKGGVDIKMSSREWLLIIAIIGVILLKILKNTQLKNIRFIFSTLKQVRQKYLINELPLHKDLIILRKWNELHKGCNLEESTVGTDVTYCAAFPMLMCSVKMMP